MKRKQCPECGRLCLNDHLVLVVSTNAAKETQWECLNDHLVLVVSTSSCRSPLCLNDNLVLVVRTAKRVKDKSKRW